jgi:coenzyme F420-reducing hydrogenase gamma subunit
VDNSPGCGSPEVEISTLACSNDVTPDTTQYIRKQTTLVSAGSCAASGGVSMGSVEADTSTAYTACCWLPN